MSPLPDHERPLRRDLDGMTTTVDSDLPGTTTLPNPQQKSGSRTTMPVAEMAGGIAGGVLLAILAFSGWRLWRRSVKRKRRQEMALHISKETKHNTKHNATSTGSSPSSTVKKTQPPTVFWAPSPTKVKFAPERSEANDSKTSELKGSGVIAPTLKTKEKEKDTVVSPSIPKPSMPKALKSSKTAPSSYRSPSSNPSSSSKDIPPPPPPPPARHPARRPKHKPSTISSGSYYSLESGEASEMGRPAGLQSMLSALGNLSEVGTRSSTNHPHRLSVSSSMWSFLSRTSRAGRGPASRFSQATSNSAYSQSGESEVGIAW